MRNLCYLTLMFTFLSSFFNSKAQNKAVLYPPERYALIEAKLQDGRPIVGSVNTGYLNYMKKQEYPWCLQIHIALKLDQVFDNGLPLKAESDLANKFEDELIGNAAQVAIVHYIGHLYNDSFLDVYAYTNDPEKVNNYLQKRIKEPNIKREFSYKIKKDSNWDIVKSFLK